MKQVTRFLSYVLVAALAAFVTMYWARMRPDHAGGKLEQLEQIIDTYFIENADWPAVEDAAAGAMVEALGDRWSYYISADQYQAYEEQMANTYVGIGITISIREDGAGFEVLKVNEGGPAAGAGMLPGDVVTDVDGQSVLELGLDAAKAKIQGEPGTTVTITVLRQGETIEMTVTRRQIEVRVAYGMMLENQVGLVVIKNFDSRCAEETIRMVEQLLAEGAEYLIFDVRFNPGGYKHELVKVLDYLLPAVPLFRSEDYAGKTDVDYSDAKCLELPMAVLVNEESYSAAEFFAAALQEYEKAVVVGHPTTGKGYFQSTFQMSDGSAVVLSMGKYRTPKGNNLAGIGITPDVVVTIDDSLASKIYAGTLDPTEDPQIQAAVQALLKNP